MHTPAFQCASLDNGVSTQPGTSAKVQPEAQEQGDLDSPDSGMTKDSDEINMPLHHPHHQSAFKLPPTCGILRSGNAMRAESINVLLVLISQNPGQRCLANTRCLLLMQVSNKHLWHS